MNDQMNHSVLLRYSKRKKVPKQAFKIVSATEMFRDSAVYAVDFWWQRIGLKLDGV